jgi:hypothetical protein
MTDASSMSLSQNNPWSTICVIPCCSNWCNLLRRICRTGTSTHSSMTHPQNPPGGRLAPHPVVVTGVICWSANVGRGFLRRIQVWKIAGLGQRVFFWWMRGLGGIVGQVGAPEKSVSMEKMLTRATCGLFRTRARYLAHEPAFQLFAEPLDRVLAGDDRDR